MIKKLGLYLKNQTITSASCSTHYLGAAALAVLITLNGCQKQPDSVTAADDSATASQATTETTVDSSLQNNQQAESQSLTILALGDSLTEGLGVAADANYPAQLQDALQKMGYRDIKVVNSGLSGETSSGLVNRLDWVAQTHPDITILTIGANDAIRGIEVTTVERNIRTAIKELQDNGSEVILGGMQIYDNLGSDYVKSFAAMYPRIAKDMNVTLIPFFLNGVAADPNLNQADAIHPTAEGYTIVVNDNILPILKPEIERLLASPNRSLATTNANVQAKTEAETAIKNEPNHQSTETAP